MQENSMFFKLYVLFAYGFNEQDRDSKVDLRNNMIYIYVKNVLEIKIE